ncbi:MarR family winged helix-turn-helix transcriptional regulator [Enterococcus sp. AZ163]|uniref:MarR family winged helix-turn-helix transcriptional regulator n=1 Tax=Enterococcus sp. AZ163 TaxID=2774638 RepID=UPI003D2E024A
MDKVQQLRFLIKIAEREGISELTNQLKPLDLTPSQSEVLQILAEKEPLSLKEIGNLIICEKNFPSRLVQKLVDKGLVFKSIAKEDSRKSVLHLTKSGRELIPLLQEKESEFNQKVWTQFDSENRIDTVIDILNYYLEGSDGLEKLKKRIDEGE